MLPGGSVPLRFTPDPPIVSCVLAMRELVSSGPLPLPVADGGYAPGNLLPITANIRQMTFNQAFESIDKDSYRLNK